MISCILFDMDGVLVDTERLHFRLWREILSPHGVDLDLAHYQLAVGSNRESLFRVVSESYGVDLSTDKAAMEHDFSRKKAEYFFTEGVPRIPGVTETVRQLHRRGYRMAVASSSPERDIAKCIGMLGLTDCFEAFCSGRNAAHPKPAPDVFLMAVSAMNVRPEECLVIEDSRNGVRAARAAHIRCWGFENPGSGRQDLSEAQWRFRDFPQLLAKLPPL